MVGATVTMVEEAPETVQSRGDTGQCYNRDRRKPLRHNGFQTVRKGPCARPLCHFGSHRFRNVLAAQWLGREWWTRLGAFGGARNDTQTVLVTVRPQGPLAAFSDRPGPSSDRLHTRHGSFHLLDRGRGHAGCPGGFTDALTVLEGLLDPFEAVDRHWWTTEPDTL